MSGSVVAPAIATSALACASWIGMLGPRDRWTDTNRTGWPRMTASSETQPLGTGMGPAAVGIVSTALKWWTSEAIVIISIPVLAQISHKAEKDWRFLRAGHTVTVMVTILSAIFSILEFRVRSRASLELDLIALRHQVTVLRRRPPGRPQLSSLDRLLWVW